MNHPPSSRLRNEICNAELTNGSPLHAMSYAELERRAAQAMPPSVVSYVAGAGDEGSHRANVDAFA